MRIAAFLAIAAIGSAALFILLRSDEPPEHPELNRLRQRVAELESENARLRESAPAVPEVAETQPDAAPAAFDREDRSSTVEAFLALLANGESAYPDLIAFFDGLEFYELERLAGENLDSLLEDGGPAVGAFVDAILKRGAVIDNATIVALHMMNVMPLQSSIPEEERTQLLLDLVSGAAGGDEGVVADGVLALAAEELARLDATEALPTLEGLVAVEGGSLRTAAILSAIASMDSPEAMASLERVLAESEDGRLDALIVASLEMESGPDSNRLLWAMYDQPDGQVDRAQVSRALAQRPENWAPLIELIESGPISGEERRMIAMTMAESGSEQAAESLWKSYSRLRDEGARGDVVVGLAVSGDEDALGIATRALLADEAPDQYSMIFESLDAKRARSIQVELARAAADPSKSSRLRFGAANALATVDRDSAVSALMTGFEQLEVDQRERVVLVLGGTRLGGESAQAALEQIANSDPSPTVRETAARGLN